MTTQNISFVSAIVSIVKTQNQNSKILHLFGFTDSDGWIDLTDLSLAQILNHEETIYYFAITQIENEDDIECSNTNLTIEYFGLTQNDISGNGDFNLDESEEFFHTYFDLYD